MALLLTSISLFGIYTWMCVLILLVLLTMLISKLGRFLSLTLKEPITTAADDKFFDIFTNFSTKIRYDIT